MSASTTYVFNNNHNVAHGDAGSTCNGRLPSNGDEVSAFIPLEKDGHQKKDVLVHILREKSPFCVQPLNSRERFLILICLLLFVACVVFVVISLLRNGKQETHVPPKDNICLSRHCIHTASKLMEAMDMSVDPCSDFFTYACGNWNKRNVIPDDKSSFNTFEKLHDDLQVILKGLLEEPISPKDSNATKKVKVLYKSCINTTQIERVGDEPMRNLLNEFGGWPVVVPNWSSQSTDTEEALGKMRGKYNAPILIDCWIGADDKNSSRHIIQLDQQVLGMTSRDYFFDDNKFRRAYFTYMVTFAQLMGAEEATAHKQMTDVLDFEIKLAKLTKPQSERHDTGALYKKMTIKQLQEKTPNFDWMRYFNTFIKRNITVNEEIVTFAENYIVNVTELIGKTDKRLLYNYILWRLIMGFAPEMTEEYQQAQRDYKKVNHGIGREKPRWQKCVGYVNERLGIAVGALFIRDHFNKESKETALVMIHNIRDAFNELLKENKWMDDETKAVAEEKANAMKERIGYPEYITNATLLDAKYSNLHFDPDEYFQNILNVEESDSEKLFGLLKKPVNKDQWEQDPAVVNAFYNPNTNEIGFPAGILQPLFYSDKFPKSLNYGGIGVVIGHEITHGFDDKGRQYDKNGNLKQWWRNSTIKSFRKQAQCMIDQYSQYKLEQIGLNIDGKNTQGENIADNGGLKQSYRAYKKWEAENGPEPLLPSLGLSHDQLFFLNYAQIWCGSMRNEEAMHEIRTSVHSPGPIRVLGPLSNSVEFSAAYGCPSGSRMNPVHKCSVW